MAQVYALVISYLRLCFPLCSLCTSGLRLRTATALAKFTCIYSSVWSTLDKSGHFINQVYYLFSLYFLGIGMFVCASRRKGSRYVCCAYVFSLYLEHFSFYYVYVWTASRARRFPLGLQWLRRPVWRHCWSIMPLSLPAPSPRGAHTYIHIHECTQRYRDSDLHLPYMNGNVFMQIYAHVHSDYSCKRSYTYTYKHTHVHVHAHARSLTLTHSLSFTYPPTRSLTRPLTPALLLLSP